VTAQEIQGFSALRSIHQDILRMIGRRREWMRNYAIVRNLVRNPKTPPGVAMNNLNRIVTRDLKFLIRDHNVPDLIRRMARRQVESRERRPTLIRAKRS
jgi:hypothetical protein